MENKIPEDIIQNDVENKELAFPYISPELNLLETLSINKDSEIYKAEQLLTKRIVVVKIFQNKFIETEQIEKFKKAVIELSKINSTKICKIFSIGKLQTDQFYLVMEYFAGETLEKLLSKEKKFSEARATKYVLEINLALKDLDNNNFIYQYLDPSSILISNDGQIKIIDFGLKKFFENSKHTLTSTSLLRSELLYKAPEQILNKSIDARSNVYVLGSIFFEMLTGNKWHSTNLSNSLIQNISQKIHLTKLYRLGFNKQLLKILAEMLSLNLSRRPTYEELSKKLAIIIEKEDLLEISISDKQKLLAAKVNFTRKILILSLGAVLFFCSCFVGYRNFQKAQRANNNCKLTISSFRREFYQLCQSGDFEKAKILADKAYLQVNRPEEKLLVCNLYEDKRSKFKLSNLSLDLFQKWNNLLNFCHKQKLLDDWIMREILNKVAIYGFECKKYDDVLAATEEYQLYTDIAKSTNFSISNMQQSKMRYYQALIQEKKNDLESALKNHKKALDFIELQFEHSSGRAEAAEPLFTSYYSYARCLALNKNFKDSIKILEKILEPKSYDIYLQEVKKRDKVIKVRYVEYIFYQRVIQSYLLLHYLYCQTGQLAKAKHIIEIAQKWFNSLDKETHNRFNSDPFAKNLLLKVLPEQV